MPNRVNQLTIMLFKEEIPAELINELFNDSEKVLKFVADIKWKEGFSCRNCGNTNYCDGKTPYARRCTRCKKEESATANTIFHNIKFPVNKAFFITYNVCVLGSDISSYNYSDQLGLNQMTCWKFRKRILKCLSQVDSNMENKIQIVLLSDYK